MYRTEYPRPQFIRKDWLCLNGTWRFEFDDENRARDEHWELGTRPLSRTIEVPFCFESRLSGIGDPSMHDHIFYEKSFEIPAAWKGQRILLHFEAVDYECRVYVNGKLCREHIGGNAGFSTDITEYLTEGKQLLSVWVQDPDRDETIPRGKQFWQEESAGIWYTRTSGIWQSVWLEPVSEYRMETVKFTPDIDRDLVTLEAEFSQYRDGMYLDVEIRFQDELICSDSYSIGSAKVFRRDIHLTKDHIFYTAAHGSARCWTPENPALYDVVLKLRTGEEITDQASGYFGMRKIETKDGMIYLNNFPYYLKLVLDQGYWREGLLTAPQDEDFAADITMMKEMGFNGCRKHQKTEDARFLYHADRLGFLVWEECPAACLFTDQGIRQTANEWFEVLARDYNHPCIIAWVPFNESWALPHIAVSGREQNQTLGMYHLLKSLDPTRLVINNDGWEMTVSDVCAIHNYMHGTAQEPEKQELFRKTLQDMGLLLSPVHAGRSVYADGFSYRGEPILITECGGINYNSSEKGNWGYTNADSEEDFLQQYAHVVHSIFASDIIHGFCYTQLSDVEQETNGLLTYDRTPKCDPAKIKEINDAFRHNISFRKQPQP